jgi:hypothetical protein
VRRDGCALDRGRIIDAVRAIEDVRRVSGLLIANTVNPLAPLGFWHARLPPPRLIALNENDAGRAVADIDGMFAAVDDELCFGRGSIGAAHVQERLGGGIAGLHDAMHAATAIVLTSHAKTGWYYHVAPAFLSAEDDGLRIVDRLQSKGPTGMMTVDEWARSVGRIAADVRIQHPLDNVPMPPGGLTAPLTKYKIADYRDGLIESIRAATRLTRIVPSNSG